MLEKKLAPTELGLDYSLQGYLQQESIAGFLFNAGLDAFDVSDKQVVADPLNIRHRERDLAEGVPRVFFKRVFNADHRVALGEITVHRWQLLSRHAARRIRQWVLEVQVVHAL